MDIFLAPPLEIIRTIVDSWLVPVDLVTLDTAYCNKAERKSWEKVLRLATHFATYDVPRRDLFGMYQNWIFTREIRTTSLVLCKQVSCDVLHRYLQLLGGSIDMVTFQQLKKEEFGKLAPLVDKYCTSIVHLTLESCELNSTVKTMINSHSALQHLLIADCIMTEPEHNDFVTRNPVQLQSLSLWFLWPDSFLQALVRSFDPSVLQLLCIEIDEAVSEMLLSDILPFCCNLRALSLITSIRLDNDYFNAAIQFCPNVLHLEIAFCRELTDDIAIVLAQGMPQLRTLNIMGTHVTDEFVAVLTVHFSLLLQALYASRCVNIFEGFDVFIRNSSVLHTLECSCFDIKEHHATMHNISTLILCDDTRPYDLFIALSWVENYGARLERFRLCLQTHNALVVDFMHMTKERLPKLRVLTVCIACAPEEPRSLCMLRAARPSLLVYYNKAVLGYDMMELLLRYNS